MITDYTDLVSQMGGGKPAYVAIGCGVSTDSDDTTNAPGLPERIRQRREQLGIGQSELADRIGVRPQTVYRYEMGSSTPSAPLGAQIARELQTSTEWLVGGAKSTDGVDRSGEPPYPAWKDFLEAGEARMAEPWMLDNLRRLRIPEGSRPTVETYKRLLFAMLSIEGESE